MAVRIDGKMLAQEVLDDLAGRIAKLKKTPRLAVVFFGDERDAGPFIRQKVKAAERIGVHVRLYPTPRDVSASALSQRLNQIAHEAHTDGIVVQLPLPQRLDANRHGILRILPEEKDVDCLSERWQGRLQTGRTTLQFPRGKATFLPPVVAAIAHIIAREGIVLTGARVAVVGWGDLVGKPSATWFLHQGATVTVATEFEKDLASVLSEADIIVSGTGKPRLIVGEMVREGTVLFDAGTSEVAGSLQGDMEEASVIQKAKLMTPVPGGLGPLAVAMLLRNLVEATEAQ